MVAVFILAPKEHGALERDEVANEGGLCELHRHHFLMAARRAFKRAAVVSAIAARLDASKRSSGAAFGARRPYVEVK